MDVSGRRLEQKERCGDETVVRNLWPGQEAGGEGAMSAGAILLPLRKGSEMRSSHSVETWSIF